MFSPNKVNDHADYVEWTVSSGRRDCFQESLKTLPEIYPIPKQEIPEVIGETGNMRSPKTSPPELGRYLQDNHADFSDIKEDPGEKVKFWGG